jgi:rhamnose transport system ATP-binding protein
MEMKAEPLLKLTQVSKSFGGTRALRDVDFELAAGEVHGLMGENGAGKSTLIKIITGALQPNSGEMRVEGKLITENSPSIARDLGIAAIYQQPALFGDLSVAENIALGLERHGAFGWINWAKRRQRARELLDRVGANISPERTVRSLTMPQQQLVEIARALGAEARVLIMDEPTASLSDREVSHLFDVIRRLREQGVGIIYISHRMEELSQIGDRVTVLRDGALVGTKSMQGLTRPELIQMMVGREVDLVRRSGLARNNNQVSEFTPSPCTQGEGGGGGNKSGTRDKGNDPHPTPPPEYKGREKEGGNRGDNSILLEAHNLSCAASGVHHINLAIRAGEIVGLAGLVGAGRTELARILFGLTPADGGEIIVGGKSVLIDSPRQAVKLGIAYVPEDRRRHGVILNMPVAANATMAVPEKISTGGWLRFGRERQIASDFVQQLGIKTASVHANVGTLSGGNQQKVALSRWLTADPSVLILDEPTQGVDIAAKTEIHRLMSELAANGMAILMICSELPELLAMADRIMVMHGGTIVGELAANEATQEKILELALGHTSQAVAS